MVPKREKGTVTMGKKSNTVRLDEAIAGFLAECERGGLSAVTIRGKRGVLDRLTQAAGRVNLTTRKLTYDHFATAVDLLMQGGSPEENAARALKRLAPRHGQRSQSSIGTSKATYRQFVAYLKKYDLVRASFDPMFEVVKSNNDQGGLVTQTDVESKGSVPLEEWPRLLDAASKHHPKTRMSVSIGLGLGRRVGDIVRLRWDHFDLDARKVKLFNNKRKRNQGHKMWDYPEWLHEELMAWRAYLTEHYGEPAPDAPVLPAKANVRDYPELIRTAAYASQSYPLVPDRPSEERSIIADVKAALLIHGWTKDQLKGEGCHTLRRSYAIVMEDETSTEGAQAALDHERSSTTQIYTGNRRGQKEANAFMKSWRLSRPEPVGPALVGAERSNVVAVDFRNRKVG